MDTLQTQTIDCGAFVLRGHRLGDMGWIIHRQALLYGQEHGWDETFEGAIAGIASQFIASFDPSRERCFIADREGQIIGSAFVVRDTDSTAKIRLVYVEAAARGLGVGRRMVQACITFARQAGYSRISLWTNDILVSARKIYVAEGFRLVKEERHRSFGHDLVGQYWELAL